MSLFSDLVSTKKYDERKFEGFSGHGDSINGELGSDLIYTKYRL